VPSFASNNDRRIAGCIERWRETAEEEVDDIGAWRKASPGDRGYHDWTPRPADFFRDTTLILTWIASTFPTLDLSPLQGVYAAIAAWHTDRNVARVPPQGLLCEMLELAVQCLKTAENYILGRVKSDPAAADKAAEVASQQIAIQAGQSKRRPKSKPKGRKANPEIAKRNKKILRLAQAGKSVDEICDVLENDGFKVSSSNVRRIISEAKLKGSRSAEIGDR
jgi:hypothetical protein